MEKFEGKLERPFFWKPFTGLAIRSKYEKIKNRAQINSNLKEAAISERAENNRNFSLFVGRTDKNGHKVLVDRAGKRINHADQFLYNMTEEAKLQNEAIQDSTD